MSRTVLSFDVGIVNLAYCIIKKEGEKFEILKWDLINIDDNKITCNHLNKNKELKSFLFIKINVQKLKNR